MKRMLVTAVLVGGMAAGMGATWAADTAIKEDFKPSTLNQPGQLCPK